MHKLLVNVAAVAIFCMTYAATHWLIEYRKQVNAMSTDTSRLACRDYIRHTLELPSAAKFPDIKDFAVTQYLQPPGHTHLVSGYVDTYKPIGNKLHITFDCFMHSQGEGWQLLAINLKHR